MKKLSRREIEQIIRDTNANIPNNDRDEMAIPSYTHNNPLIRWLMWRRYEVIDHFADMSKDSTVLEFGCGMGLFLPNLAARCRKAYAIDRFPQFAKTLVENYALPVQFYHNIIDIPDSTLDHIIAADVLEHVDNLKWWIQIFHDKLKAGGAVLVSGPTENTAYRIGRFLAGFSGKADYHHTNIDSIRTAFESNGFKTDKVASLPLSFPPHLFKVFRFRPVNNRP